MDLVVLYLNLPMPLYISSINSGSNANCYYVGNNNEGILVDAGLSCRETEKRMGRLGIPMEKVKALFISHEHSDHITGLPAISRKYQLPVYITPGTLSGLQVPVEPELVRTFRHGDEIAVGDLSVKAFLKSHDAADPHSFLVSGEGVNVGVFTDLGYACKELLYHFKKCHAAFLESNYCETMLENGRYPEMLKKRIRGKKGHLSNDQALEIFVKHRPRHLTHLLLSHLSQNNNKPELVQSMFDAKAGQVEIIVASRYAESPIYTIEAKNKRGALSSLPESQGQLSLF